MQTTKIPATIVTGFLGSGKTTLMRHILQEAKGLRVAVIVNEFGELGIDGEILRTCAIGCREEGGADAPEGRIYELANGCMCCTVQEEFFPVMQALAERRADIDVLLIETSGLALPKPLVQAFQWPEIASVGLAEHEVKESGREYKVGRFPFSANGRARTMGETTGFVKFIADATTDELLGAHLIGPNVSELCAEVVLAFEYRGSSEDLGVTVHSHPTLSEAVKEAALGVLGRAIHL